VNTSQVISGCRAPGGKGSALLMNAIHSPRDQLDPGALDEYLELGIPTAFSMLAEPPVRLTLDPGRSEMRLATPADGRPPDVNTMERLSISTVRFEGATRDWFELTVDASEMPYDAYVLLQSMVDHIRGGSDFRYAVAASLLNWRGLLASRHRLSDDAVTGLLGELLVFKHLLSTAGARMTSEAWLGPVAGEHDFAMPTFDLEVKTTRAERRVHVIGSEMQLKPTTHRPLFLASVQITSAGASDAAFTLTGLIDGIREDLAHDSDTFETELERIGWRREDSQLYATPYQLRARPRLYQVDASFPAITPDRLQLAVPNHQLITSVAYRVDTTDYPTVTAPSPLAQFFEEKRF
jgi:hypothetical protein